MANCRLIWMSWHLLLVLIGLMFVLVIVFQLLATHIHGLTFVLPAIRGRKYLSRRVALSLVKPSVYAERFY